MNKLPALTKPFYFDDTIWGIDTWPLLSAAYAGDVVAVTRIFEENVSRAKSQFAYYEPLHYAVKGGHINVVKILLEYGAHPKAPGWYALGDETPIAKAIDRGFTEIAELLEKTAATMSPYTWPEVKAKTVAEQLKYDFEIACGYNPDPGMVESVLAAHPNWVNLGLYEAIHHDRMGIIKTLLSAGGDVNGFMPFACWFTPLMHALRYKEPRWGLAELLLDLDVPVNGINGLGMSALHIVTFYDVPEAAIWLLEHGADINLIEPEFCSTSLGWAARWGRTAMAGLLIERGADKKLAGADWAIPIAWAQKKGNTEIVELLNGDNGNNTTEH